MLVKLGRNNHLYMIGNFLLAFGMGFHSCPAHR